MIITSNDLRTFFHEPVHNVLSGKLCEEVEFYVVCLLARMHHLTLENRPLSLRVLGNTSKDFIVLRAAGDEALFVSGWFPEHLSKRGISRDYYATIGMYAYSELAKRRLLVTKTYAKLAMSFNMLQDMLHDVRDACIMAGMDKETVLERWLATRSAASEQKLNEFGLFIGKSNLGDT